MKNNRDREGSVVGSNPRNSLQRPLSVSSALLDDSMDTQSPSSKGKKTKQKLKG